MGQTYSTLISSLLERLFSVAPRIGRIYYLGNFIALVYFEPRVTPIFTDFYLQICVNP